jgi:hypothetical protein
MNRKLVSGMVAGLAAIVLATSGGTLASFDGIAGVPGNVAGAGTLELDLDASGTAGTALSFTGLKPGIHTATLLWVAANDAKSAVPASLTVTLHHFVDRPGACDVSLGKAEGVAASGIAGCTITTAGITGIPVAGAASRLLDVTTSYVTMAVDPSSCAAQFEGSRSLLPTSGQGDLYAAATAHDGAGTTVPIVDTDGRPVVLAPGLGVCFAVSAYWPPSVTDAAHASPEHPVDNAAQVDSFSVDVRFDLTQVAP